MTVEARVFLLVAAAVTTSCSGPNLVRVVASVPTLVGCSTGPSVQRVPVPSNTADDRHDAHPVTGPSDQQVPVPSNTAGDRHDAHPVKDRLYRVTCAEGRPAVFVVCDENDSDCSASPSL